MEDVDELLRKIDAIEGQSPARDVDAMLAEIDQIEGRKSGEVVYVAKNGGRVVRGPDGKLSYADEAFATSDPQDIQRIMSGESAGDISISGFDKSTIAQAPFAARVQEFVRGIPFVGSYTDEAADALGGKGATARALSGAMRRENPVETAALNVGGAIAGSIPAAMAAPEVAALAPVSRGGQALVGGVAGTALGASEGAVYGYGENRDAATGALIGGALGGALGIAAPYVAEAGKNLSRWFKTTDVSAIASELGVSKEAATVIRNAFRTGDRQQAESAISAAGRKAMLADAGQPARELLDASAAAGGEAGTIARRAVDDRAAAASGEIKSAFDDVFGGATGQRTAQRNIRAETAGARGSAYDAAYAKPINYAAPEGQYIEGLLSRVPQSAINTANELMRVQGVQSKQIIARVGDDGRITYERLPDVQQLHYILQALDDTIEGAKTSVGRGTTKSTAYSGLRSQLANTLKRAVPEFKQAQDVAADSIRREKAIDTGYNLLTSGFRREQLSEALQGASKAERDAIKQGVRSYLDETLSNVRRTITDPNVDARQAMDAVKTLSSPANRAKLTKLLGKADADKLFEAIDRETIALELRAAIATNSKTAIRQSIQQGVKDQTAPGIVGTLTRGDAVDSTKRIVQALTGNTPEAEQLRQMGIFEEIARALTQVRGKGAERALKTINAAIDGQKMTDAQAAQIAQVLTASTFLPAHREGSRALSPR